MENNKNTQYELNKGLAQMLKGGVDRKSVV